jgi:HD-GYP domain-containing protein (c-di-GMP phosphodiesterase class II)
MTSDRPYRSAMTVDDACREIARGSGTQFDPHVVDAFLAIPVERLRRIQDSAPHADRLAVAIG